ncbi:MAG: hypothetical protein EZS28_028066 [Streblomastix strix]|uniref:Uncharacterized protein n=1 Tax=Streblomastix strix TaxID=222440 RepID=A0A5J4V130_9EUKA|nr:MAG: hypothetical protein EZS28_028066 [Streblomastix strix]
MLISAVSAATIKEIMLMEIVSSSTRQTPTIPAQTLKQKHYSSVLTAMNLTKQDSTLKMLIEIFDQTVEDLFDVDQCECVCELAGECDLVEFMKEFEGELPSDIVDDDDDDFSEFIDVGDVGMDRLLSNVLVYSVLLSNILLSYLLLLNDDSGCGDGVSIVCTCESKKVQYCDYPDCCDVDETDDSYVLEFIDGKQDEFIIPVCGDTVYNGVIVIDPYEDVDYGCIQNGKGDSPLCWNELCIQLDGEQLEDE